MIRHAFATLLAEILFSLGSGRALVPHRKQDGCNQDGNKAKIVRPFRDWGIVSFWVTMAGIAQFDCWMIGVVEPTDTGVLFNLRFPLLKQ